MLSAGSGPDERRPNRGRQCGRAARAGPRLRGWARPGLDVAARLPAGPVRRGPGGGALPARPRRARPAPGAPGRGRGRVRGRRGARQPARADRHRAGHGRTRPSSRSAPSEQKARWIRPLWTGEEVWCQLFSEPGAGSTWPGWPPGRSVRTVLQPRIWRRMGTALPGRGRWVVNGQKVWTSMAHHARWGLLAGPDRPGRAQARRADLLRLRHDRRRGGGPAPAPAHRRGRVQRGLPDRRGHPRR